MIWVFFEKHRSLSFVHWLDCCLFLYSYGTYVSSAVIINFKKFSTISSRLRGSRGFFQFLLLELVSFNATLLIQILVDPKWIFTWIVWNVTLSKNFVIVIHRYFCMRKLISCIIFSVLNDFQSMSLNHF